MSTVQIAVSDEDPDFGVKFANWIKLQLLMKEARYLLQLKFKERWFGHQNVEWDSDPTGNADLFMNGCGKEMFKVMRKNQQQKQCVASGDRETWDMTILTDILRQVDFGQGKNEQEEDLLGLLKKVRNAISHTPKAGITDEVLGDLWAKAEKAMVYFGAEVSELQKIKECANVADLEGQDLSEINKRNSNLASKLKEEGDAYYRNNQFENAVKAFTDALALTGLSQLHRAELYANRSAAYLDLADQANGESAQQNKRYALADAKKGIELRPAWCEGYLRAGRAYHVLRKYEKAIRAFDWALSLAPDREEIQHDRDASRRKLAIDARHEHFDRTTCEGVTWEDMIQEMQRNLGVPLTEEMYRDIREMMAKGIPGLSDVFKGHDYSTGAPGLKQDYEAAARCYSKAMSAGNAEGVYFLACCYQNGRGVEQDFEMATQLFKHAANLRPFRKNGTDPVKGVAESEHALGLCYEDGVGVPHDYNEARKWYERASAHGSSRSANNLAFMYKDGKGVRVNIKKAGQYWHLAAMQRNHMAMQSLASYYMNYENDPDKALYWNQLAIEHGNYHAKMLKNEFDAAAAQRDAMNKTMEKDVAEFEAKHNLAQDGMKLEDRVKRMPMTIAQELTEIVEGMIGQDAHGKANVPKVKPLKPVTKETPDAESLLNPIRAKVITYHRQLVQENARPGKLPVSKPSPGRKSVVCTTCTTTLPTHKQAAPTQLSGLKSITLKDMKTLEDQVYEGHVLSVRSIEDPTDLDWPSIKLVLEDENQDVCRASIYNFGVNDPKEIYQQLGVGAKFSIMNPYWRIAGDGGCGIRVDDRNSIFLHCVGNPTSCRFCLKGGALKKCSKCKRTYCDRECQLHDWKLLKHKLICN